MQVVIVALDIGEARIGVATSDELELVATPHPMIRRKSSAAALDAVAQEIARAQAQLVVVGLPISFDGQLHGQARAIQAFAERLRRRIKAPLIYADETLSSVRAEERLREAGVRPERMRERIDSEAAAVILEDVLEQRRRERELRSRQEQESRDTGARTASERYDQQEDERP
ncbi:MAG TPA: Holliday junction resolvase RuvX [Ktedonobacterales bacterium]|jgi:putative Holliday junction resolvase|nr:Holliday junction resolvase RuvX [Ktedonobacterales bacterium]